MDSFLLQEEINNYIKDLKNTNEYLNLKKTYDLILIKYSNEVKAFKEAKLQLEKALEYGDYYPGLKEIKAKYQEAKANLYSKEEVKEYFFLAKEVEDLANNMLNAIKKEII